MVAQDAPLDVRFQMSASSPETERGREKERARNSLRIKKKKKKKTYFVYLLFSDIYVTIVTTVYQLLVVLIPTSYLTPLDTTDTPIPI
jgi:hypothetical protein